MITADDKVHAVAGSRLIQVLADVQHHATLPVILTRALGREVVLSEADVPKGLVIRSAKKSGFIAGADINMLKTADPTFKYYFCLHANETLNRLEQTPKLVIAALNLFRGNRPRRVLLERL